MLIINQNIINISPTPPIYSISTALSQAELYASILQTILWTHLKPSNALHKFFQTSSIFTPCGGKKMKQNVTYRITSLGALICQSKGKCCIMYREREVKFNSTGNRKWMFLPVQVTNHTSFYLSSLSTKHVFYLLDKEQLSEILHND